MLRVIGVTLGGEIRVKNRNRPSRETKGQNSVPAVLTSDPRFNGGLHVLDPVLQLMYRSSAPTPSLRAAAKTTYRSSASTKRLDAPESALMIGSSATGAASVPSPRGSAR